MESSTFLSELELQMNKVVSYLEDSYKQIQMGRANPSILEKVNVDYYGSMVPVNQCASISAEARSLIVKPWDLSILNKIEKAIQKENLGLTPINDGEKIRLNFPVLTEEERIKTSKQVSKLSEESKIGIRNIRRDFMSKINNMNKSKEISDDESSRFEEKVQDFTDLNIKRIDGLKDRKISQIMEV